MTPTVLAAYDTLVAQSPDAPAVRWFDAVLTRSDISLAAERFAGALRCLGVSRSDRVALYLQNDPQFIIALLGVWRCGAVAVMVNPMNTARELNAILSDSGARVLVTLESLHDRARPVADALGVTVITTSERAWQRRDDWRVLSRDGSRAELDLLELVAVSPALREDPDDLAFITYTSGTTGAPKGAMNTHANLLHSARVYRDWMGLHPNDVILGVAPVFHITGAVAHVGLHLLIGAELVITHRFDAHVMVGALAEHRATFATGVITAFNAMIETQAPRDAFSSLRVVYSGGAPIAPALAERFKKHTGVQLHSIYGLTETTSPSHAMPLGSPPRVDPVSGAMSVGVPVTDTASWICGEEGTVLSAGEPGEIMISGPQVVPGYWQKNDDTAAGLAGGVLATGDVGFVDEDGWFFVIDRKKDMINASGYKVWPREVEDVLCSHPAVREAAVVGVPDEYRGETVVAFVVLRQGAAVGDYELAEHCREHLAAYKRPREITFLEDLPKTASGKVLRRELRGRHSG